MDSTVRRPFQGITNIVRFNWHFYLLAIAAVGLLCLLLIFLPVEYRWAIVLVMSIISISIFFSLLASFYVYDYSAFYNLTWLDHFDIQEKSVLVNIHAGFDETSNILSRRFPSTELKIFDFYDPQRHTEVSIERARKTYAPANYTQQIATDHIPLEHDSIDFIFNIFAAHEIRDAHERIEFLKQLKSSLKITGRCIVVEHLRDLPNFIAYNIGFLHFFSRAAWMSNFTMAGLTVQKEIKNTPFVSIFILSKANGDTP